MLVTVVGLALLLSGAMWLAMWTEFFPLGGVLTTLAGAGALILPLGGECWSESNSNSS